MADEPFHVFRIIYGPGVYFHAQVVALFYPLGMLLEYSVVIIGSGATPFFQFLRVGIAFQIIDGSALWGKADKLAGGVAGEGDVFHAVFQGHVLYHFHDLLYGARLLFGSFVGFELEDEAGVELLAFVEVLLKGGELLAVVEDNGGALFSGGVLHADAFEDTVVVYHELIVGSEPDVELGAVAMDRVGLDEGGDAVLGRAGGFPVAAVSDDLGALSLRSAERGNRECRDDEYVFQFHNDWVLNLPQDTDKLKTEN